MYIKPRTYVIQTSSYMDPQKQFSRGTSGTFIVGCEDQETETEEKVKTWNYTHEIWPFEIWSWYPLSPKSFYIRNWRQKHYVFSWIFTHVYYKLTVVWYFIWKTHTDYQYTYNVKHNIDNLIERVKRQPNIWNKFKNL